MKIKFLLALTALALALGGCSSSTEVSGSYQTPQGAVDAVVGVSTNGVDLSATYATTNQTVGGTVEIKK